MTRTISLVGGFILAAVMSAAAFGQCGPYGCCPNGQCPLPMPQYQEKTVTKTRPASKWRYERATGYRAAVVRVVCHDSVQVRSKGSGVLVRWGERIVVITARHVIQDAKSIFVKYHTGRKVKARVLKVDRKWDCAILDVGDPPADVKPAEMAYGDHAMFSEGVELETCGYGSDDKLAVNEGAFQGYRRSSTADGPDDWMAVSGHARQGDSGGPVFDSRGRVVGVLWGTDGQSVFCVQPGRIHVLLQEVLAEKLSARDRQPTPPAEAPLEPVEWKQPSAEQAGLRSGDKKPMLPWRADEEAVNRSQSEQIDKLIQLERLRAANAAKSAPEVSINVQPPEKNSEEKTPNKERSPLLVGLVCLAGIAAGCFIFFGGKND